MCRYAVHKKRPMTTAEPATADHSSESGHGPHVATLHAHRAVAIASVDRAAHPRRRESDNPARAAADTLSTTTRRAAYALELRQSQLAEQHRCRAEPKQKAL